jgi:hypothetical protein
MHSWQRKTRRGIHYLSKHDADKALILFREALEECPISQTRDMSRLLFYMGVTLKRLGCLSGAIQSWLSSLRLNKDRYAMKMIKRHSNCYGMERQETEQLDDWRAFQSIQVSRYLSSKRNRRFSSEPERDMVMDLIGEHWNRLIAQECLEDKMPQEKKRLFQQVKIVFPFVLMPEEAGSDVIQVDFRRRRRMQAQDRCYCGSGLPFLACCGRIQRQNDLMTPFS